MAERTVRTVEGARLFGQPIGTIIRDRTSPEITRTKRAVSMVRLRSIQRQFEIAKRTGNTALMRDLQEQFTALVKDYSGSRQLLTTIQDLVAQRGRNDQSLGKKANLTD